MLKKQRIRRLAALERVSKKKLSLERRSWILTERPFRDENGRMILPGLPDKSGEHQLKKITGIISRPQLAFSVLTDYDRLPYVIHWLSVLSMRPYNILPDYLDSLRSNPLLRNKIELIRGHPILDFISSSIRLYESKICWHNENSRYCLQTDPIFQYDRKIMIKTNDDTYIPHVFVDILDLKPHPEPTSASAPIINQID